ncbi:hypothetical protein HHL19_27170 [Streptomyces sp. R302]|uniref:hypothetical protein n=1 Tax=unclassified Streptomyces TaxID=2593676 RepID=UPI00145C6B74|nr:MULTISPECIES: hypothetical protein [unclassified Streptomyces]NML52299.1 hypothetical protein [Streptomyces sp. R301]NML82235.1 hypothetical protein [Streptomyces sp. R302]
MGTPDGATGDDELTRLRARVTALEAGSAQGAPKREHHRWRSFLAGLLVVVGCVLVPLGLVAAWTADLLGDTDRYVQTMAPLASDPDVQAAVATRVTDAVMDHIDLESLLQGVAPDQRPLVEKALGKLGGSLEGALASFVHDRAQDVVASPAFETIWTDANRLVHTSVDRALTGDQDGAVKIETDTVTIDLAPVIERVKERLVDSGLTVAADIPEVHTSFTVLRSDDIGKAKTGFALLQAFGVWLPVIAVLCVAGGVLLAVRRRRALVAAALGFALAALVLGIALTVFRTVYLNALPSSVSPAAAGSVYDTLTRFLRTSVRVCAVLGVLVALAAWLSGPSRPAVLARGLWHSGITASRSTADRAGMRLGPVGGFVRRFHTWIVWILVVGAALAFVLWPHPTGWVVIGLALALLFALAVTDFLAGEDPREEPEPEPDRADTVT